MPKARKKLDDLNAMYAAYLEEEASHPAFSEEDMQRMDVAPLPPREEIITLPKPDSNGNGNGQNEKIPVSTEEVVS